MHEHSFLIDYGWFMAASHEMLAVIGRLLHGLPAPVAQPGIPAFGDPWLGPACVNPFGRPGRIPWRRIPGPGGGRVRTASAAPLPESRPPATASWRAGAISSRMAGNDFTKGQRSAQERFIRKPGIHAPHRPLPVRRDIDTHPGGWIGRPARRFLPCSCPDGCAPFRKPTQPPAGAPSVLGRATVRRGTPEFRTR